MYTNPLFLKCFLLECCVFQPFSTVVVAIAAIEHFSCVISIVSARCLSGHQVFLHFDLHQKKFWKELFVHKNTIYVCMKWYSCHLVVSYYSTSIHSHTWHEYIETCIQVLVIDLSLHWKLLMFFGVLIHLFKVKPRYKRSNIRHCDKKS